MSDCIFCKFAKHEVPTNVIYEDEKFIAFLDRTQFVPGHTLVIPKAHVLFVWDIENYGEYAEFIKKIANHFRDKLGFPFVDSLTSGRNVAHAHTHLIPHENTNEDWRNAMKEIRNMTMDESRWLSKEKAQSIVQKFKL